MSLMLLNSNHSSPREIWCWWPGHMIVSSTSVPRVCRTYITWACFPVIPMFSLEEQLIVLASCHMLRTHIDKVWNAVYVRSMSLHICRALSGTRTTRRQRSLIVFDSFISKASKTVLALTGPVSVVIVASWTNIKVTLQNARPGLEALDPTTATTSVNG